MTLHTTPMHDNTHATVGSTAAIIPFHVAAAPDGAGQDLAPLALARLKAFLEEEGSGLSQVFSLFDQSGAAADVEALHALLKEPGDMRRALAAAEELLGRIAETLAEIPPRAEIQRPICAGEAASVRDFDAMVRWLGARSEEMRDLARHVLG